MRRIRLRFTEVGFKIIPYFLSKACVGAFGGKLAANYFSENHILRTPWWAVCGFS
jgi:hypothetical protein